MPSVLIYVYINLAHNLRKFDSVSNMKILKNTHNLDELR